MSDDAETGRPGPGDGNAETSKGSVLPIVGVAKPERKKGRPWLKPLLIGIAILALVVVVPWALNYWSYAQTHVSTDDAYVTGSLINVSPIVSGTLVELNVDEGAVVRKGQLLARLDDSGPRATVRQAQANYNAALSQIPQAERNLIYQRQATEAAIQRARAALQAQHARAAGARRQVALTTGTTASQVQQARAQQTQAAAQAEQSEAQVQAARASLANYEQAVVTAQAALDNYRQQVVTAERAASAADAKVNSARAEVDRAARDEERYRILYNEDAVAAQVWDNARAQARTARSALAAATAQADEARSQVEQARAAVRQAQSQVEQARRNVAQGQALVKAAQRAAGAAGEQVNVARAGVGLALANAGQVGVQQANLATTTRQTGESQADIAAAQAGREQVAARRSQIETARAQAEQARAALTNAQIALGDTYIYAPTDGTVVRKTANVGASLAPGSPVLTLTVGDYVWVDANFKETQLRDVRPGQPAEIEVDAFPGIVFKGRVRSINEATGAATSLLPPENATGNFTKVVQRIPVRIEIEPASDNEDRKYARAADIRNLRQGMSVTATIDTAEKPDRSGANAANGSGEGVEIQQTPGSAGGGAGIGGSTSGTGLGAGGAAADGTPGADGTTGSPRQASGAVGQQGTAGQRMSRQGAAGQSTAQPGGPPTIPNPGAGPFGPDQNNPNSARSPGGINNGPALERPNIGTPPPPGRQGGFGTPGVVNPSGPAAGAGAPTGGAGASPSPSTPGPSGPSGPGAQGGAGTGGAGR